MKPPFPDEARRDVADLAKAAAVPFTTLDRVIDRSPGYVARYVREGVPTYLADRDAQQIAAFFGIDSRRLRR